MSDEVRSRHFIFIRLLYIKVGSSILGLHFPQAVIFPRISFYCLYPSVTTVPYNPSFLGEIVGGITNSS